MNKKPPAGEGTSRGSILCMSSCAGLHPLPMAPMYSVSKFGVVGLARAMADMLGEKGIQINALAPGVLGMFPLSQVVVVADTRRLQHPPAPQAHL